MISSKPTTRLADADPDGAAHDHRSGPDCDWCPLCRLAAALRAERPEIKEKIADAATALSSVLRSLMDAAAAHSAPGSEPAPAAPEPTGESGRSGQGQEPEPPARPRPRPGPA